jgi:hypothetical protein
MQAPHDRNAKLPRTIGIVLVLLCGCLQRSGDDPLTIWQSTNSTPEQRMEAVNKLIAPGATDVEAERILGSHGRWTHFHGPRLALHPEQRVIEEHADEWSMEYQCPGGFVALFFEHRSTNAEPAQFRFLRASVRYYPEIELATPTNARTMPSK